MKHLDGSYMVLGLAGRARAGKDTCADVLSQAYQFYRMAFADALRKEIIDAFGIDADLFHDSTKDKKDTALAIGRCNDAEFMALAVKMGVSVTDPRSPREIMRWWGTEYRRRQNPTYWLERAAQTLDEAMRRGFRRVVITDVRFRNEADFVRYYDGLVWKINRAEASAVAATHQSEIELGLIQADAVIDNNRSMTAFAAEIMKAYRASSQHPIAINAHATSADCNTGTGLGLP